MSKIVDRTLDVFELFASERRPLSLTDMARLLGIPMSSCYDLIRALEARGYVYETGPRAGYYPTRLLYNVCDVIVSHDSLVQRALPLMEAIRDSFGETVTLAKATGTQVFYLQVLEPEHPIRYSVTVGSEVRSLHATSAGKAFLSSLPERDFEEFLQTAELARLTGKTLVSKRELASDLKRSKTRGWFLNREESLDGVVTLSSPFFWNNAFHAITMAGPADRMEEKLERAAAAIMEACRILAD